MSNALAGRTAIVTGASRGLGAEIARAFWDAGASLFLVARSHRGLAELQARLGPDPARQTVLFPADLADEQAPGRIADAALAALKRIDILVNNAAIQGPIGPAWENDWAAWKATIQVDLLAPVALCRRCLPSMIAGRYGKIINISGGGGTAPRPRFSAYAAAKAALVRFSETLAEETRDLGIGVNCIAPGIMGTEMQKEVRAAGAGVAGPREYQAALQALTAAEEISPEPAQLAVLLASEASDGITGRIISAMWDPWRDLPRHRDELLRTDVYTVRRIRPEDRGLKWSQP